MRNRILIAVLSLLLVAFSAPAAVSAKGPIPGCPPARLVSSIEGPWNGGAWFFPRWSSKLGPLRLAIIQPWFNLDDPDIVDHPRNPGQPAWHQTQKKVMITPHILRELGGDYARIIGMGGEAYIYKNNKACRHNIRFEFQRTNMSAVSLARLADEGLAYIY